MAKPPAPAARCSDGEARDWGDLDAEGKAAIAPCIAMLLIWTIWSGAIGRRRPCW
ncbi:MAG: hypothetical protein ACK583_13825 [Cyanobacteriota bacterium]